tara:strand:- start:1824 stop:2645 length:822 start_codon:yes stop_codon:yes gene_type:complete
MPFSKEMILGSSGNQGSGVFYSHQIEQSCRFDEADSSRLYRDFGTPSSATALTISFWLKIVEPEVDGYHQLFSRGGGYAGGGAAIALVTGGGMTDDTMSMYGMAGDGGGNNGANNNGNFRLHDPASWYHIHWKVDTSKSGMSGNNAKVVHHINGVNVVFTSTNEPSGNLNRFNDNGSTHSVGNGSTGNVRSSYLAEFIFLDGQYEDYTSFGEFKNGVWIPKDPSGLTFGNNGFHLKFENASDLGNDSSGNNNDFTATGLGTDHQVLDSPTFGD